MNIIKRLLKHFFIGLGRVTFDKTFLTINNYPFDNSIVSHKPTVYSKDILNINLTSTPPTICVDNELIFISAEQKHELAKFASRNNISISDRPELWDWILEPFLDTEFTDEHKERLYILLEKYNLQRQTVDNLRAIVEKQMIKYNSIHWEWGMFSALDVLQAMRPKLNERNFIIFYNQVMEIALRPDNLDMKPSRYI